jgi:hypothetical protein
MLFYEESRCSAKCHERWLTGGFTHVWVPTIFEMMIHNDEYCSNDQSEYLANIYQHNSTHSCLLRKNQPNMGSSMKFLCTIWLGTSKKIEGIEQQIKLGSRNISMSKGPLTIGIRRTAVRRIFQKSGPERPRFQTRENMGISCGFMGFYGWGHGGSWPLMPIDAMFFFMP